MSKENFAVLQFQHQHYTALEENISTNDRLPSVVVDMQYKYKKFT